MGHAGFQTLAQFSAADFLAIRFSNSEVSLRCADLGG
jgi:hypothetical protein